MQFEWDSGNSNKNWLKHKISNDEAEQAFVDPNARHKTDLTHSADEPRHILLGKTKSEKLLYIAFTVRKNKIRIISARKTNHKEKYLYEKKP